MTKRIALLFSGQGAQAVGMGRDLTTQYPAAGDLLREADAILGRPLSGVMFDGPESKLVKTANCQPALSVHGLACLALARARLETSTTLPAAACTSRDLRDPDTSQRVSTRGSA